MKIIPVADVEREFFQLLFEAEERLSVSLPDDVEVYTVNVLHRHLREQWSQQPLALRFLELNSQANIEVSAEDFLMVGDTALLVLSFQLPKVLRRGLTPEYYQAIGSESYAAASVRELSPPLRDRDARLSETFSSITQVLRDVVTFSKRSKDDQLSAWLRSLAGPDTVFQ